MALSSSQSQLTELAKCKSETIKVIHSITSLLEDILPNARVIISKRASNGSDLGPEWSTTPSAASSLQIPGGEPALNLPIDEDLIIPSLDLHPLGEPIKRVFKIEDSPACILHRIRPHNSTAWGFLSVFLRLDTSDLIEREDALLQADLWIRFATTILERKILEEQVQTIQTRLQLATKAGGIGIYDLDLRTNKLFWTPQMLEIFGVTAEEFRGTYEDWSLRILPEDLKESENRLQKTFQECGRYFHNTHRVIVRDGEMRWVDSLGEIFYDDSGHPLRLIGTAFDCTSKVKAEAQMTHDRRRLELALEAGELGCWDWNVKTGDVQFGGEWARMLGYNIEEIEPYVHSWETLVHPDDLPATRASLARHLDGLTPIYESEHRLRAKDGSWVWVLDRGRVVERDTAGNPLRAIGIHANVTAQRAIREQLREADRRKDEFLATLAHELRNPLAPIRTGLAILKRDPSSESAAQSRDIMERQLAHMVRLIDDLLDVSRVTRGQLVLKREDVSIRSVVQMAIESSKPIIDAGGHTLTTSFPDKDIIINCDATRIAQTISNLLTNAAKYTQDRGQISLSVEGKDSSLIITVTDNGLGIPKEYQERVFDMFGQVNRNMHRAQGGLGIGLALVKNLVALHGGSITVSSEGHGKGSSFTVTLPLQRFKTADSDSPDSSLVPLSRAKRVLIVDDNVDAATSLSMFVDLLGHKSEVAFSGQEALSKAPNFKPDIIFLDIGLPGLNGIEVAKVIRHSDTSPIPHLVALTGWGTEETKQKTKEAGFDEHLTKPVELARVESILQGELPSQHIH
jgi:PAS domain S-box-containing protein